MPTFIEQSNDLRDTRVNPAHLNPLPRLSPVPPPRPSPGNKGECYEVVIVGSGPAGIMTSVLLARYGITSVLTVDKKPSQTHAGQADGIQPRTLEVLQSLDLAHEVITQGCQMHEVGFWNPSDGGKGIVRTAFAPDVSVPARYPHEVTIHQGRIERILNEDLEKNGNNVERGWRVLGWKFDYADKEFPVIVRLSGDKAERVVRAKYLVGADGAHSTVREGMGLKLVGDHTDHVWGVMDSVVKTNFPDIRKRCAIHSSTGSIMVIPRERISGNQVLTRIYCQMGDEVGRDPATTTASTTTTTVSDPTAAKQESKERRGKVSLERIISQSRKVFTPYKISFKDVDWWAAYQIGQRAAPKFSLADENGVLRVHIAGDACHTHSPKAGQGMNVSMMDAYNLSWKLAHVLNGLSSESNDLLATYEHERLDIARQLIEFDTKFSSMFSGKIGAETGLTHEQFLEVFRTGSGFTSGCGIEYPEGILIAKRKQRAPGALESGLWAPGRRLMNVRTKRLADANPRDIHDDMPSNGRYRIILALPASFKVDSAAFADTIKALVETVPTKFPAAAVETVLVYPGERGTLEWSDFPECVLEMSEWLVLGDHYGTVYRTWGIDEGFGAVAVVRPDGYVGAVSDIAGAEKDVAAYLGGVLKSV